MLPEWVRVWTAFLVAERTENLGLEVEARGRLTVLAREEIDRAEAEALRRPKE